MYFYVKAVSKVFYPKVTFQIQSLRSTLNDNAPANVRLMWMRGLGLTHRYRFIWFTHAFQFTLVQQCAFLLVWVEVIFNWIATFVDSLATQNFERIITFSAAVSEIRVFATSEKNILCCQFLKIMAYFHFHGLVTHTDQPYVHPPWELPSLLKEYR